MSILKPMQKMVLSFIAIGLQKFLPTLRVLPKGQHDLQTNRFNHVCSNRMNLIDVNKDMWGATKQRKHDQNRSNTQQKQTLRICVLLSLVFSGCRWTRWPQELLFGLGVVSPPNVWGALDEVFVALNWIFFRNK